LGHWPGIADRLRVKLRERGYWNTDRDRPQLMRFAAEHGFNLLSVMDWMKGKQPSYDNLLSLASALDTTPAWLMFGADGGRELVTATPSSAAKKPRASKRSRTGKIIGAVALFGAILSAPSLAAAAFEEPTYSANYVKSRRRRTLADQLALDLAAA